MSSPPTAPKTASVAPEATRWVTWWLGTWLVGVTAGSIVIGLLHAPSRPDDPAGPGDVLQAPIGVLAASLVALWAAYLTGVWLASQRAGTGDVRRDIGLAMSPVDLVGVPIGVVAQLALIPLLYVPLRAGWPDTFDDDRLADTARDLLDRADGGLIVLLVALVVVGAPVVEEIFFRGMLQRPLVAAAGGALGRWGAVVLVAALFAAVHFRPVEFVGLFAIGLVLGACTLLTGRIGMAIVAHVAFNATGIVAVL